MIVQTVLASLLTACSPSKCEDSAGCGADTGGTTDSGADSADSGSDSGSDSGETGDSGDTGLPPDLHGTIPDASIPAPEFSVLNQDEQVRTRDDLLGHPTIV